MIADALLFLVYLIMWVLGVTLVYAYLSLAPWVPTPKKELERINRLANLKRGDLFYEIGCGTAIVSSYIAKKNPEAEVVGIELAVPIFLLARFLNKFKKLKNLRIEFGNAFAKDYSNADVVYIYGLPKSVNGKLKAKLEKELKPGARFISYAFTVNDWKGSGGHKDKPNAGDVSLNVYVK